MKVLVSELWQCKFASNGFIKMLVSKVKHVPEKISNV